MQAFFLSTYPPQNDLGFCCSDRSSDRGGRVGLEKNSS